MFKVSLSIAAMMFVATMLVQVIGSPPATDCTVTINLPGEAPKLQQVPCSAKVNWAAWATGKSRSPQAHFLDLLELIFGQQQKNSQRSGNHRLL